MESRYNRRMESAAPFDKYAKRYDAWFSRHAAEYRAELSALRGMVPRKGRGLEIGVGTGRFAASLGVRYGVDPAMRALRLAAQRGVLCVRAVAQRLPFKNGVFDYAVMVTTLCFLDDPAGALEQVRRALKPGKPLIVAFLDRDGPLGRRYAAQKRKSVFYRGAVLYTPPEVERLLASAGFRRFEWVQALATSPHGGTKGNKPEKGFGKGSFVVVRATRV